MARKPAYIISLERDGREATAPKPLSLRQCIAEWFDGMPEMSRRRPFAMAEIEAALGKPGRILSGELLALGWRRNRKWTGNGRYPRYWMPPELMDQAGVRLVDKI